MKSSPEKFLPGTWFSAKKGFSSSWCLWLGASCLPLGPGVQGEGKDAGEDSDRELELYS